MSSELAIKAQALGKSYAIYDRPHHRLFELLGGTTRSKRFWALKGLDLEIKRGETVGIIGRNGSGKSTFLQMIAGTLTPTEGSVIVNGRVAALLELGSGFNPEFTGRENVYLNASLYGLATREIDERIDSILEFADIGAFVDQPVRSYSSGMVMRLAFSVIVHVQADILIIDEALSVGDAFFTQKCMRFLRGFQERGTLLFVSHDTGTVTGLCDRAIWLDHGQKRMEGTAREVADAYLESFVGEREGLKESASIIATPARSQTKRDFRADLFERSTLRNDIRVVEFNPEAHGFGNGNGRILDVVLLDTQGQQLRSIIGGETVVLEIIAESFSRNDSVIIGFYFKDRLGQLLFGDNTCLVTRDSPVVVESGGRVVARFQFDMPRLQQGEYFITVGLASGDMQEHVIQHWMHEALLVIAEGQGLPLGIIGLPMSAITLESVA